MIEWSQSIREQDPGYFCRLAIAEADSPVWLVCDARRTSDMDFFKRNYGACLLTVRVEATEEARRERGWVFVPNIDDSTSECGLDQYKCGITIHNNSQNEQDLVPHLEKLTSLIHKMLTL